MEKFYPKVRKTDVSKIEIEVEKIYWENIPDLKSDQGLLIKKF
jgi:hypothetical protein